MSLRFAIFCIYFHFFVKTAGILCISASGLAKSGNHCFGQVSRLGQDQISDMPKYTKFQQFSQKSEKKIQKIAKCSDIKDLRIFAIKKELAKNIYKPAR